MSRIVLDTNSLIQSIPPKSKFHKIWESFLDETNELCVSTGILISNRFNFELIKADPDDNKFVDCAIVANAKFIVTEDHHFDILRQYSFPKIEIMNLDDFLSSLI